MPWPRWSGPLSLRGLARPSCVVHIGVLAACSGCAEPPQNTSPYVPIEQQGPPPGGPSSGAERAADAGGAPGGGDPPPGSGGGEPGAGAPGDGPPGGGEAGVGGCRLTPSWEGKSQGGGQTLSGRAVAEGTGQLLVDIVDEASSQVVWGVECSGPGNFTAVLPAELGTVWVAVYLDLTGDGPSADDPQGRSSGSFSASSPPDDLEVVLATDAPITGIREPGGGPPPGEGGAEVDGAPPSGDGLQAGQCRVAGEDAAPATGASVRVALSGLTTGPGSLLVDVVREADNTVAHSVECAGADSLELQVPAKLGKVYLAVYQDTGGDGPSDDDPQGRSSAAFSSSGDSAEVSVALATGAPLAGIERGDAEAGGDPPPAGDPGGPPPGEPDPGGPPPGGGDGPPTDAPPADAP